MSQQLAVPASDRRSQEQLAHRPGDAFEVARLPPTCVVLRTTATLLRQLKQPQLQGPDHGLRTVGDAQLGDNVLDVILGSPEAYHEFLGDPGVGVSQLHQPQYLRLAGRKRLDVWVPLARWSRPLDTLGGQAPEQPGR